MLGEVKIAKDTQIRKCNVLYMDGKQSLRNLLVPMHNTFENIYQRSEHSFMVYLSLNFFALHIYITLCIQTKNQRKKFRIVLSKVEENFDQKSVITPRSTFALKMSDK